MTPLRHHSVRTQYRLRQFKIDVRATASFYHATPHNAQRHNATHANTTQKKNYYKTLAHNNSLAS
eukprot:scaffold7339_cov111-Skeletonema_marinoi.AAC.2